MHHAGLLRRDGQRHQGLVPNEDAPHNHHLGGTYPLGVVRPTGVDLETWKATPAGVFDSLRHEEVG